jgi:hypothetical protein
VARPPERATFKRDEVDLRNGRVQDASWSPPWSSGSR